MHQRHCSTVEQRIHLSSQMIAHQGSYGIVSQLSQEQSISRQTLYTWKQRGQKAMKSMFTPKQEQEPKEVKIERVVLTLFTDGHASREGIQRCIEEILGEHISLGKISEILEKAGKRAQEYLESLIPAGKRVLALDEQYGSKRGEAYLNIVDANSSLVLASAPPVAVDGESWSIFLLQMKDRNIEWGAAVSDGGKAIQDALHEITPENLHQRDVWHVLHECQKVQGRVDREVEKLHEQTPVVERQAKRVAAGHKPRGNNPKTDPIAHAQDVQQMEYITSSLRYLSRELQRLLGIVVLADQKILDSQQRQEELESLLDLFAELCEVTPESVKKDVEKLFSHIQTAIPSLVSFCPQLDAVQHSAICVLGQQAVHLIGWAWLRRAILGPKPEQLVADFPPDWQPVVAELFEAWNHAVRSSSVVENWHSIVRPYLAVHRHLSAPMLALLAVWHNHRVASRGSHQGESPLMRSGLAESATDWLQTLGYPPRSSTSPPISFLLSAPQDTTESAAA
jgi:hypothetical protein